MSQIWGVKPIGELVDIQNGFAFKSKLFSYTAGIPLIRIRDLKTATNTETFYTGEYDPLFIVDSGDLLIGMDGEFKCYEWKGGQALLNQRVCRLVNFSGQLDRRFLLYGINKYLKDIEDITSFTTVKHLSAKSIKAIEFPLPPLEEQKRIVSILDQAFEGLDRARENAEANLKSAKELFKALVNEAMSSIKEIKRLDEICDVRDGTHDTPKYVESGYPLVTQKNIRLDGLSLSDVKYIDATEHEAISKRSGVNEGDILISMIGANRGMTCVVDTSSEFSIKNVGLIKDNPNICTSFLNMYLTSNDADNYVASATNGGAQPFIGLGKLRAFPVPAPNLQRQKEIANKLSLLKSKVALTEASYKNLLIDMQELRRSLLQKAFSGELT